MDGGAYSVAKRKTTLRGSSHGAGRRPNRRDLLPGVLASGVCTTSRALPGASPPRSPAATCTNSCGRSPPPPPADASTEEVEPVSIHDQFQDCIAKKACILVFVVTIHRTGSHDCHSATCQFTTWSCLDDKVINLSLKSLIKSNGKRQKEGEF